MQTSPKPIRQSDQYSSARNTIGTIRESEKRQAERAYSGLKGEPAGSRLRKRFMGIAICTALVLISFCLPWVTVDRDTPGTKAYFSQDTYSLLQYGTLAPEYSDYSWSLSSPDKANIYSYGLTLAGITAALWVGGLAFCYFTKNLTLLLNAVPLTLITSIAMVIPENSDFMVPGGCPGQILCLAATIVGACFIDSLRRVRNRG